MLEIRLCSQFLVLSAPFPKRMCVHFFAPNQIASHEDCHVFSEWTPLALDMSVVRTRICKVICGSTDSHLDSSILLSWNKWIMYIQIVWDKFTNSVFSFGIEMKIIPLNIFSFTYYTKDKLHLSLRTKPSCEASYETISFFASVLFDFALRLKPNSLTQ